MKAGMVTDLIHVRIGLDMLDVDRALHLVEKLLEDLQAAS